MARLIDRLIIGPPCGICSEAAVFIANNAEDKIGVHFRVYQAWSSAAPICASNGGAVDDFRRLTANTS
jgi:hypothetical protein